MIISHLESGAPHFNGKQSNKDPRFGTKKQKGARQASQKAPAPVAAQQHAKEKTFKGVPKGRTKGQVKDPGAGARQSGAEKDQDPGKGLARMAKGRKLSRIKNPGLLRNQLLAELQRSPTAQLREQLADLLSRSLQESQPQICPTSLFKKTFGPRPPSVQALFSCLSPSTPRAPSGRSALPPSPRGSSPLARTIRNAYKGASAGQQEAEVIRRVGAIEPRPTQYEFRTALAGAGLPAHRASKVQAEWESLSSTTAAEAAHADAPTAARDCPAYIRQVFENAPEARIPSDVGAAVDRILEVWKPGGILGGEKLLSVAGIPERWHGDIILAATLCDHVRAICDISKRAPGPEGYASILCALMEIFPLPTLEVCESLLSGLPKVDRQLLLGYFADACAYYHKDLQDKDRKTIAWGWASEAFADRAPGGKMPVTWKAALPVLFKAYETAAAGQAVEDVSQLLKALRPLPAFAETFQLLEKAGTPSAHRFAIAIAATDEPTGQQGHGDAPKPPTPAQAQGAPQLRAGATDTAEAVASRKFDFWVAVGARKADELQMLYDNLRGQIHGTIRLMEFEGQGSHYSILALQTALFKLEAVLDPILDGRADLNGRA